jgi:TRAP-type C4-dicarboxylate transport system permease small subunit
MLVRRAPFLFSGSPMKFHVLTKIVRFLVISLTSLFTFIIILEVFLRYVIGISLSFSDELSRYLMIWVIFLASSLAIKEGSHMSIELFVGRFKGKARVWLNLGAQMILLTFLIFLLIESVIVLSNQMGQMIPTLGISIFWFYLALPVGAILMILYLLPAVWENLKGISGKTKLEAEGEKPLDKERGTF